MAGLPKPPRLAALTLTWYGTPGTIGTKRLYAIHRDEHT